MQLNEFVQTKLEKISHNFLSFVGKNQLLFSFFKKDELGIFYLVNVFLFVSEFDQEFEAQKQKFWFSKFKLYLEARNLSNYELLNPLEIQSYQIQRRFQKHYLLKAFNKYFF